MNIVLPFHNVDKDQAIRWLKWCAELGLIRNHKLWLMPAMGTDSTEALELAARAFVDFGTITDSEGVVSDWTGTAHTRDASGPNSSFRQVAWHFHLNKLGYWFFCEPDCIPTKKEWADVLDAEYVRAGKPFMGNFVKVPAVMDHLTGCSVYHEDTINYAPTIVSRRHSRIEGRVVEIAFDVAGSVEILAQAHITNLIQHCPRHPGFKSMEEVDALLDPNAVMFHMQKDGSLIPFLREKIFCGSGTQGNPAAAVQCGVSPASGLPDETTNGVKGLESKVFPEIKTSNRLTEPQTISEQIRHAATRLELIYGNNTGRLAMIQKELRKRKLIPKARKRK